MALRIVNPQPNYPPVKLIEPAPLGYLHVAAVVDPPRGRIPFPGNSPQKAALLTQLTSLARQLERLSTVEKATVYRAILIAPPSGYAKQQPTQLARYDVVVLIETTSPEVTGEVQTVEPYKLLVAAVQDAARDVHMMAARCVKRVADVDKTRQGLFLFNYFVADDAAVALQRWDHSVPRFMLRQLTKPSFRRYLLANLQANRTGAMPSCTGLPDRLVRPVL